tara:strand:- start:178 stop:381 length:204 start_codon:yes stop_codon:yes gene_type:complete
MDKNLKAVLGFLLIVIMILWIMNNNKVEVIGNFFEKIINPISKSLGAVITFSLITKKIARWFTDRNK